MRYIGYRCKEQFCWECLVLWRKINAGTFNHLRGCPFRDGKINPSSITGTSLEAALRDMRNH